MKKEHSIIRTGLGQSSHRFLQPESSKPCIMAGIIFDDIPGFQANSDGDVIFTALCNAISSLTHIDIIGDIAQDLFTRDGITDSEVYLREALKTLKEQKINYIALTLEAKRPSFKEFFHQIRKNIAHVMNLHISQIGITAISADGLTDYSCGYGVKCLALITTAEEQ